jgi:predicted naringenin-chalcone synthase
MANMLVQLYLEMELLVPYYPHILMTGPEILAEEISFYNNEHMMGFKLTNSGLQMVLDIEVPDTIAAHFL